MKSQGRLFEENSDSQKPSAMDGGANAAADERVIARVMEIVRAIPPGRVLSYGAVGARCEPPISGYICGRIMNGVHEQAPWWRVVAKDGGLPVSKRNPLIGRDQRDRLEVEGVEFDAAGRVKMAEFGDNGVD